MPGAVHTSDAPPVVCGVDRSDRAGVVIRVAATLAAGLGTRLVVVHAADWPSIDVQTRRSPLGREWAAGEHRRQVAAWVQEMAAGAGVPDVDVRVEIGVAVDWLFATAEQETAALVVVGRRDPRTRHALAFSVSANFVQRAPCPVVVVPPGTAEGPASGQVLCGVEGPPDVPAAHLAAALAIALDATLTLVHVLPSSGAATGDRVTAADRGAVELLHDVARLIEQSSGPEPHELRVRVEHGDPGTRLADLAAREPTALIVVRSRRRGVIRAGLLGSTSRRLAGDAPCPVLIHPLGAHAHLPPPRHAPLRTSGRPANAARDPRDAPPGARPGRSPTSRAAR